MHHEVESRFQSFDRSALDAAAGNGVPRPAILEVHPSPVCQLRCPYCHSMSSGLQETIYDSREPLVTVAEYEELFTEFRSLGGREIVVSGGGEPFLYRGIRELMDIAESLELRPHVYTNGLVKKHFSTGALSTWLPKTSSVRFSLHRSAWLERGADAWAAVHRAMRTRNELGAATVVTVAILVDSYHGQEVEEVLRELATVPGIGDRVELRVMLPPSQSTGQALAAARRALKSYGRPEEEVETRALDGSIPGVPVRCFALYRNVVVDPFGGFRLCCMRAHNGRADYSYIASLRQVSLKQALSLGRHNMSLAGRPGCATCSVRDSIFSELVDRCAGDKY